jgi:hypothetical protein
MSPGRYAVPKWIGAGGHEITSPAAMHHGHPRPAAIIPAAHQYYLDLGLTSEQVGYPHPAVPSKHLRSMAKDGKELVCVHLFSQVRILRSCDPTSFQNWLEGKRGQVKDQVPNHGFLHWQIGRV